MSYTHLSMERTKIEFFSNRVAARGLIYEARGRCPCNPEDNGDD